ncbi:MAG: amino acid adenylation domain-containing protein [Flavobacteriales bacterium]|nr:amino acid adenylation domain-containing protein [Flavobacteriales bacterium]MCB9194316.1 amino acid adenylation domain-containing protein [Flavobacteriales bacterium]
MERFIPQQRLRPVEFDPFAGPAIVLTYPTTAAQREVWTAAHMSDAASCAYNEAVTLELRGELDRSALERAIDRLVHRHEGLRTVINSSGTRGIVLGSMHVPVNLIDLTGHKDAEMEIARITTEDLGTPFDLLHGPLFRVQLIRIAPHQHQLRLTGHHIICDGWSLGIIMADISRMYTAFRTGAPSELQEAQAFSAYALALQDLERSSEHAQIERFWLEQFAPPLPLMDLPVDHKRPREKTYNGARIDVELPQDLVKGLKAVATRSGSSFVTTLLTAFETFLYAVTGDPDLVVGLPAAGQNDLGMKDLVGHCVNLLALRSRIDEDLPFIDHLKERRGDVLDAFDHQRYTFGTLLQKLHVPREPGRIPLVPVVFNVDMNMDDGVAFAGLEHRWHSDPRQYENFELFLNATGNDERLVLEWSYNTDLFDAATIHAWTEQFRMLVSRITTNASSPIGDLIGDRDLSVAPTLPPAEWTAGPESRSRERSVMDLFEDMVQAHPDRVALEHVATKRTYRELHASMLDLCGYLAAEGVGPGDPVGLCVDRGPEMIVAMLAILHCGACFVPFDPAYPKERLTFMFADTNVGLLLTQSHLRHNLPPHGARVVLLDATLPPQREQGQVVRGPESPAYIMYTSGSTGTPKGVVVPDRAIVRLVRDQNYLPFGPDLTFLQLSNISFDASTLEIWGALLNGARLVLQPQQKPTLQEITTTIAQQKVTTAWFTAGLFNLLVDEHLDKLRPLRHILTGGDVLSVPHVKKALRALGPGVLINGYGPTENTTFTCCHPIDDADMIRGSVPIGRPIGGTQVHVLDAEMKPVPVGMKGELYAGGDGVALGYWKRADLTAERFVPDPFRDAPGAMLYRTGDLVRWTTDGLVEFIGRTDDQVKVRGFRIELGEIENAVEGVGGIKDRVVIVRNDLPGEKQIVCYLVPVDGPVADDESQRQELVSAVRDHLRDRLPDHMLPTAYAVLKAFPLNPNGKVDKKALPAPVAGARTMRAHFVAPRNEIEKALAAIWEQVLGNSRIGVHDNFFELGGHSLIGIQLLALVEERFGRNLPLRALFEAPTIASFAELLAEGGMPKQWTNLSAIQPNGDRVPFFCVHGDEANHFLPRYLGDDQPFYGFFHQGEDGRPIKYTQVEEIARHFVSELRSARPRGPYMLGGYSFGGIVAYEMAQQLTDAGQEVALLALFDTYDPVEFAAEKRREGRVLAQLKQWLLCRAAAYYLTRGKVIPPKPRHYYIIDTYDKAIGNYRPRPYRGPIAIFRAAATTGPRDMGWKRLAAGPLEVIDVPGDHYNMIKEPHVKVLAEKLQERILRVVGKLKVEAV